MLSTDDIQKLTEYQKEVFKDVFFTKEDGQKLETKINNVQSTLDAVLKEKTTSEQDRTISNRRIKDLEGFADKAAPKLGLEFKP